MRARASREDQPYNFLLDDRGNSREAEGEAGHEMLQSVLASVQAFS
jgi:hypothetical protein